MSIPLCGRDGAVIAVLTILGAKEDFAPARRRAWEKVLKNAVAECENPESGGKTR